jgi:poly(3-hydroxybutyrate) depolymerase
MVATSDFLPVETSQLIVQGGDRTYHVHVPAEPAQETVPAIVVFHGDGQDATTIARRWGVEVGSPVPASVADYLLVFPESDPRLSGEWVHFQKSDGTFPTFDLEFVDLLVQELTTRRYFTESATVPEVFADPASIYAAGFSSGAGMVWQLMNSDRVDLFRGFATVGHALDPEKAQRYRSQLTDAGESLRPVPVAYVHGTGDHTFRPPTTQQEVAINTTKPAFTVAEMLARNGISPTDPAAVTTLIPGSANLTEVVAQLYLGDEAFLCATVINGGHNWPGPTTVGNPPVASHFDATATIVEFWRSHAGLL